MLWLSLIANKSFAQQTFALKDIAKIEMTNIGGGMSEWASSVEVVREGGSWKSYQTNLIRKQVRTTSREFLKTVPEEQLNRLLALVAKGESVKNIEQFDISSAELISYIDSLDVALQPATKNVFVGLLQNEAVVKKSFDNVTEPFIMDDRTYYGINFLLKDGTTFTIEARSFGDLYYLPWQIGKAKSYDPAISIIFESLMGNDAFASTEKQRLNKRLVQDVYWKHLYKK